MGSTRFDPSAYASYASATSHRPASGASFTAKSAPKHMDPKMITVRESVKSDLNPHPTPVIVGLDVTGSMASVVESCRRGLGTLFEQIIARNSVPDPHVLAMAIGDMDYDRYPVQATQFEADPVTIGRQIEELCVERGGGGNDHESYLGPLYFALMRTKCDAFSETPPRKGFVITVGDELPQTLLKASQIEQWFGDQSKHSYTAQELLAALEPNWHVIHAVIEEGNGVRGVGRERTLREWSEVLGQRVIMLKDHTKMAEVIISTIEVTQGRDKDAVSHSWSGDTSLVVRDAIAGLATTGAAAGAGPVAL